MKYIAGETAILKAKIRNPETGEFVDPATSFKITVNDYRNGIEVDDQAMTKDSVGQYHYDWNTSADTLLGIYYITYTAVDSSRVSIAKDSVEIV